jgi:hypothetical protein
MSSRIAQPLGPGHVDPLYVGQTVWRPSVNLTPASANSPGQLILLSARVLSSHLGRSIAIILYDAPKVILLLVMVVFAVGIIRSFFTPERTRQILEQYDHQSADRVFRTTSTTRNPHFRPNYRSLL